MENKAFVTIFIVGVIIVFAGHAINNWKLFVTCETSYYEIPEHSYKAQNVTNVDEAYNEFLKIKEITVEPIKRELPKEFSKDDIKLITIDNKKVWTLEKIAIRMDGRIYLRTYCI